MSEHLKLAEDLFARGLYADALSALRAAPAEPTPDSACLTCECLQYTGRYAEAYRLASSAIATTGSAKFHGRYFGVLGRIELDRYRLEEASETLAKGIRAAERFDDAITTAWLQQLWLISSANAKALDLRSNVRAAYRSAVRSGSSVVLAGFHLRLSQLEGQRGAFANALHHLDLAQALLDRVEHVAMFGILHVNRSCVLGLTGDFDESRKNAEAGALYATRAGHLRLSMSASACAAHSAIATGDLSVAESWLKRGLAIMNELGVTEGSLLENLASIELIRGRLDVARRHLDTAHKPGQNPSWVANSDVYTLLTQLQLYKAEGAEAKRQGVLGELQAIVSQEPGSHLAHLTSLAETEFLFDQDRHAEAEAKLLQFLQGAPAHSVYGPDLNRLAARSIWLAGKHHSAARRLARACTVADARGTRFLWAHSLRERLSIGAPFEWEKPYNLPHHLHKANSKFGELLQKPTATWFDSRSNKQPLAERDPLDGFEDAFELLNLSDSPELRGREAMTSAIALGIAHRAALLRHGSSGIEVLCDHNWSKAGVSASLKRNDQVVRIGLSPQPSGLIELLLEPMNGVRPTLAIRGLGHLLKAAEALEAQKKDSQRLSALWQPEVVVEEPGAVFSSPQMVELMQTAKRVASTTLPVLLVGDTGTGKEVVARALHRSSSRANKAFLAFNCSAVPRDMVESQLFGFRRGSFTGASGDFLGIIRSAEGGTLFLDEIGELSPDLQPKLLRFLETNEVHPLGEGRPIKVDVRVIAATNADLDDLIKRKLFREDLYYRLNIVQFQLPPLSDRREEIPALATYLLHRFEAEERKHSIKLSDELMEYFLLYRWPGNVRQLANELRRMVAMVSNGETLGPEQLSSAIRATRRTVESNPEPAASAAAQDEGSRSSRLTLQLDQPLPNAVEALERAMIEHAIARADGRIEEAARMLGISRKGLFLKRRRWLSGGDQTRS